MPGCSFGSVVIGLWILSPELVLVVYFVLVGSLPECLVTGLHLCLHLSAVR